VPFKEHLTVKLTGRALRPDQRRGGTLSCRARGDTTGLHGPLQRLLDGIRTPLSVALNEAPRRTQRRPG
jgi:hypothetical protein